ncbi:hypothetical protein [Lacinutrix undariae]
MKKIVFYISSIIALFLLISIIQIIVTDFSRLTQYGFGYLFGKIILLVVFASLMYFTKSSVLSNK